MMMMITMKSSDKQALHTGGMRALKVAMVALPFLCVRTQSSEVRKFTVTEVTLLYVRRSTIKIKLTDNRRFAYVVYIHISMVIHNSKLNKR